MGDTYNEVANSLMKQLQEKSKESSDIFAHLEWAESESEELKVFQLIDQVVKQIPFQIMIQSMRFDYQPKHMFKDNKTHVTLMIRYRNRL